MKKLIYQFFAVKPSEVEIYLTNSFNIDPRIEPTLLIKELRNSKNAQKFIKQMNKKQSNGLAVLRKFSVIHLILMHSNEFEIQFQQINFSNLSSDDWINENVLRQYGQFLRKIIFSEGVYNSIKTNGIIDFNFNNMFYVNNLLTDIFLIVKKIAPLARYYKINIEGQKPSNVLDNFVCLMAYQAQQTYAIFKIILGEAVRFPKKFMQNPQDFEIIKYLLQDELVKINENLKNLFLDKYFFPYGKGFGVKLLRLEQLPDQSRDFVDKLLYDKPIKVRSKNKKKTLESFIFDETGKMNQQFYQNLVQITMGDETLRKIQYLDDSNIENQTKTIKKLKNYQNYSENI